MTKGGKTPLNDSILFLNDGGAWNTRQKLAGIVRFARMRGWEVVALKSADSRPDDLRGLLQTCRLVGCIVECSSKSRLPRPSLFGAVPIVWLDPPDPQSLGGAAVVACDNAAVARAAFRELSSGLPTCYAAVPSHGMQRWCDERIAAFQGLCADDSSACHVFPAIRVRRGHVADDLQRRRRRLAEWVATLPAGCAIFAANDFSALDVAQAARAAGRAIPRDLTLVGADGWGDADDGGARPRESSVQLDFELSGYLAARLLSRLVAARGARDGGGQDPDPEVAAAQSCAASFGPLCVLRRESTGGRGRRDPHVMEAVEIIRREAHEGLTAARLAEMVPGSRKHFERRFREAMGHSVLDEIMHVRLQAVKDLLSKPELPIGAIADFCGFGSQVELRIVFREREGMSLREWRNKHLGT